MGKLRCVLSAVLPALAPIASGATLEECSPQLGTNVPIVWQATMTPLPKCFWTYRRLPQEFSAAAISNGIVLASFQKEGFPRPSKKGVVLWADHPDSEPIPPYFDILPKYGQMSFTLGDRAPASREDVARDEAAVKRAMDCAVLLGINRAEFAPTNSATSGTYGVFLTRLLDGIPFANNEEGFHLRSWKDGRLQGFALIWPKLVREKRCEIASTNEIIQCMRTQKAVLIPEDDDRNYFARVKVLSGATRVIVKHIEPWYMEGDFGEEPLANDPPARVVPVAEINALFEIGTNKETARLYTPVTSLQARRVLDTPKRKPKQLGRSECLEGSAVPSGTKSVLKPRLGKPGLFSCEMVAAFSYSIVEVPESRGFALMALALVFARMRKWTADKPGKNSHQTG